METTAICDIRLKKNAPMIDGAKFNYDYSSLEKSYSDIFHSGAMVDGVYHYSKYEDLLENDTLDYSEKTITLKWYNHIKNTPDLLEKLSING